MHVSCRNRGIVELDLQHVFANEQERGALSVVKSLDLSHNELRQLKGMQPFSSLIALDLAHNKIAVLQGLPLGLVRLNVSNNQLSSLAGIRALPLQEIDASNNRITEVEGICRTCPVQTLKLNTNRLVSARGLENLTGLTNLEMESNYIRNVQDLRALTSCRSLRSLTLRGNPVAEDATYRREVADLLPQLRTLDGGALTSSRPEREVATPSSSAAVRRNITPVRTHSPAVTPRRPGAKPGGSHTPASSVPSAVPQQRTPRAQQRGQSPRYTETATSVNTTLHSAGSPQQTPVQQKAGGSVNASVLSFDGVRSRAEGRRVELSSSNRRLEVDMGELRHLLEEEYKLTTTLQREKKGVEKQLAEAKKALAEELGEMSAGRAQTQRMAADLKTAQQQNEKLFHINKSLENKLKEEKARRLEDVNHVKSTHNAVLDTLRHKVHDGEENMKATHELTVQWEEERMKSKQVIKALEAENNALAIKLSKYENAAADMPHMLDLSEHHQSHHRPKVNWTSPHESVHREGVTPVANLSRGSSPLPVRGQHQQQHQHQHHQQQPSRNVTPQQSRDARQLIEMSRNANATVHPVVTTVTRSETVALEPERRGEKKLRSDEIDWAHPSADTESVASEKTETTRNALEFAVHLKKWLLTEMDKQSPTKGGPQQVRITPQPPV